MGVCFSSVRLTSDTTTPTAKVVSFNGDLSEYPVPVVVSQILFDSDSFFVCNSDCLYYDQLIPKLQMDHQLQPNHIYFLLPLSWLERPLSPSNMANLAVKATVALHNSSASSESNRHRRNKSRISPTLIPVDHSIISMVDDHKAAAKTTTTDDYYYDITIGFGSSSMKMKTKPPASSSSSAANISRSTSVKKLRRFTSSRAKMAVRSFRLTLTTIYEGTVL